MASLVLIAVMVAAYAGIFLTSIWLCATAEREQFPVRQPVPRPLPEHDANMRPAGIRNRGSHKSAAA